MLPIIIDSDPCCLKNHNLSGLNIIIYKMGAILPVKPTGLTLWDLSTSDGLSWEPLGTTACFRLTHKDRAPVRMREEFSHFSTSLISSPISLIRCRQYPSMFMLGANTAHLLCSREGGGSAWRDHFLLFQAPPEKTEHLPQLTCGHSAPEHVRKSQIVDSCSALTSLTLGLGKLRNNFFSYPQDKAWGWGPQNTAIHILVWGLGSNNEPNCPN